MDDLWWDASALNIPSELIPVTTTVPRELSVQMADLWWDASALNIPSDFLSLLQYLGSFLCKWLICGGMLVHLTYHLN